MPHTVFLVRHGEHLDAEHGVEDGPLSPRGVRQAQAAADRLSQYDFERVLHSPLERAWDTARVFTERMPAMKPEPSALLMDCVPSGPSEATPASFQPFFNAHTAVEFEAGRAQMEDAVAEFLAPGKHGQNDLLITHNTVIAWFVREVLEAPDWKWATLQQAHCGLTVLQKKTGTPWTLLSHNDLGHLPVELRTGQIQIV